MSTIQHYRSSLSVSFSKNAAVVRGLISVFAGVFDAATIIFLAIVTGLLYHSIVYHDSGAVMDYAPTGFLIAWLYLLPKILRNEYEVTRYINFRDYPIHSIHIWNLAFACMIALAFLTKTGESYSRGWIVMYYGSGMAAVVLVHTVLARAIKAGYQRGFVLTRQLFLVGGVADVRKFMLQSRPQDSGLEVIGTAFLPEAQNLSDVPQGLPNALQYAVAYARSLHPDDVFIITPWSHQKIIDQCVEAFMTVPASIHLGPEHILNRFEHVTIEKNGSIASLHLLKAPMSLTSILTKRLLDIAISVFALITLFPLFVIVAILIKLDSPGPALFIQRRYGFNLQTFWIFKFRTMVTTEDGPQIVQATEGDERVTRVGQFLRRWNIDELPQLINVIRGDMSLVGPRPHALTHDETWGQQIARYARRHNMRPGMTGWAQVNGWRGDLKTDAELRDRILHDLYYIDNWSHRFDIQILFWTIFSRKAYRNAH